MTDYSNIVAGVDEAGRGPLFGPVVACAVIFNRDINIDGISDSKKLSSIKRQSVYDRLITEDIDYGLGIVDENVIDDINILNATKKAMLLAVQNLKNKPEKILIDGNQLIDTNLEQEAIVKGDQKIAQISAASIIAKVTRDSIVNSYDKIFPMFYLSKHKGYGTKKHIECLNEYGATSIHRKTFRPIYDMKNKSIQNYEPCHIVQYALNLVREGVSVYYFNNKEKISIIHSDKKNLIYTTFVDREENVVLENIITEIKEKDSILNRRLDVIYIHNNNAKIIQSCQF